MGSDDPSRRRQGCRGWWTRRRACWSRTFLPAPGIGRCNSGQRREIDINASLSIPWQRSVCVGHRQRSPPLVPLLQTTTIVFGKERWLQSSHLFSPAVTRRLPTALQKTRKNKQRKQTHTNKKKKPLPLAFGSGTKARKLRDSKLESQPPCSPPYNPTSLQPATESQVASEVGRTKIK